jgi:hypothetical protein
MLTERARERKSGSGRLGGNRYPADAGESVGRNSVISSMTVTGARAALLLDIGDFAAGSYFAVPADNASASESGEAEKPNETHNTLPPSFEQYVCRRLVMRPSRFNTIIGTSAR